MAQPTALGLKVLIRWPILSGVAAILLVGAASVQAASQYETEQLYFAGQYDEAAEIARQQVEQGVWNELWPELYIRCLLTRGEYAEARQVYEGSLKRYGDRLAYRQLGAEVYRFNGDLAAADRELTQFEQLIRNSPWRYGSSRDQVTIGRFFADRGEDGRLILELLYDRVRKQAPTFVDVYFATAELAIAKADMALAVEQLKHATELQPSNPYGFYLMSIATRDQEGNESQLALSKALELNSRHVPSLLLQADRAIDAENYQAAERVLEQVLEVNRFEPRAWAYLAVLANLQGQYGAEGILRKIALEPWPNNYEIDHLMGLKLSQKYRFREGVAYQRLALEKRSDYLPAKFQLANDLLRLGENEEGWRLAQEVQKQDNYHVVAYNLVTLKDELDRYRTLENEHFVVRMEAREAEIYGEQVMTLLEEARSTLCPKYDIEPSHPVYVEIFPRQQDFAIRTFGLPGGAGYLGVCFGQLITANSPASQGTTPTNWQSVLWHEFCHVVTLQKTANRMPRWLSEGISVFEERQRNPAWGQKLTPVFHQWLLGDELTPVSQLSGAFLHPPSGQHLQFAYYEASLVVEFLLEKLSQEGLRRVLADLSVGMPIETSLGRYLGSIESVDKEFAEFARQKAARDGASLDWTAGLVDENMSLAETRQLLSDHPQNYFLAWTVAQQHVKNQDWREAADLLGMLLAARPHDTPVARLLARCQRELGDAEAEEQTLVQLLAADADALDALTRLLEIARGRDDWDSVRDYAQQLAAINPMLSVSQQALLDAAAQLQDDGAMIAAQRALLQMDPPDLAAAHFRLAGAYLRLQDLPRAKRHALMALEEAPRYRDAQRLLLEIVTVSASVANEAAPTAVSADEATRESDGESGRGELEESGR